MSELHLVIVWEHGRHMESTVRVALHEAFRFRHQFEVKWSPGHVLNNFSRFYAIDKVWAQDKIDKCGSGQFLVCIVEDLNPRYELRETLRGRENINVNLYDFKQDARQWMRGTAIHTSLTPYEFTHDMALLLGSEWRDLWPRLGSVNMDLSGTGGWQSVPEMFLVMNDAIEYLVLRNFDTWWKVLTTEAHPDIDILAKNPRTAAAVMNAEWLYDEPRISTAIPLSNGMTLSCDVRYVGDNYYDTKWASDMLDRRVLDSRGFYIPSKDDYHWSLMYHTLIHKPKVADDYMEALARADGNAGSKQLEKWMAARGYTSPEPNDPAVYYKGLGGAPIPFLRPKKHVLQGRWVPHTEGDSTFSRVYDGAGTVLKQASGTMAHREFAIMSLFDSPHFPKAYWGGNIEGQYSWFEMEKVEGVPLRQATVDPDKFSAHMRNIVVELAGKGVQHRDITPDNIIIRPDGTPVLLDFGWATMPGWEFPIPDGFNVEYRPSPTEVSDDYAVEKIIDEVTQRCRA